jgi:hypothetical protein
MIDGGFKLTIRRQRRRTILNNKRPVPGLRQACLQPVQPRRTAGLQALRERQAGAVVAAAGDGEVGEDEHVGAFYSFVQRDGGAGGHFCAWG